MLCWRQAVEHENSAKRNFEAITGQYSSSKFFQSKAKSQHEKAVENSAITSALKNLFDASSPKENVSK